MEGSTGALRLKVDSNVQPLVLANMKPSDENVAYVFLVVKDRAVAGFPDMEKIKKRGYKPVIVSQAKRDVILKSELYADIKAENPGLPSGFPRRSWPAPARCAFSPGPYCFPWWRP